MQELNNLFDLSRSVLKSHHRKYKRFLIKEGLFEQRMSVLLGQRGVGKTTLLVQYLYEQCKGDIGSEEILFLPVDHLLVINQSLYEIADTFHKLGGKILCLDEIHKCSDWSRQLKSIYDTFSKLKVIASGSSALQLYKGSHDLSRRAIKYSLPGLSFREYLELREGLSLKVIHFDELIKNHEKLAAAIVTILEEKGLKALGLFKKYLHEGYYPFFTEFKINKDLFYLTIEQNAHTSIESDLLTIHATLSGESVEKIKRLLGYIAGQTPFKPDMAKLARALDLGDSRTIKTYIQYLKDADVISNLYSENKSLSSFEKPAKIYLNNTNQIYAFGKADVNIGTIREAFFMQATRYNQKVFYTEKGDFKVNGLVFEVGGKNKGFDQIKDVKNSFVVVDDQEIGFKNKIPLWLFGFLY